MKIINKIILHISRVIYIPILVMAGVSLTACNDFLTRDSPNQTTDDDWWQTKTMLQTVMNQLYRPMPSGTLVYNAHDISQPDYNYAICNSRVEWEGLTDNGVCAANYISMTPYVASIITGTTEHIQRLWDMKWMVIRRCSRYLENYPRAYFDVDQLPHEGIQTIDRWAAEARALRAFYHLELFLIFGRIPIVDHPIPTGEQMLARRPENEVVEWIASEFELAAENLPTIPQVQTERWRWTRGACYSWLSYLYIQVGDWANAKKWAEKVIDMGIYELYRNPSSPATSYIDQFTHAAFTANTKESILTKEKGCGQASARLLPPGNKNGGSAISPTASLVNEYELADGTTLDELDPAEREAYILDPLRGARDPRLTMTICFPGESFMGYANNVWNELSLDYIGKRNSSQTGYWVKKWVNTQDYSLAKPLNGTLDFQIMRYAVVLLNYAEAAIELNELGDEKIYDYLNDIRNRAGMPDVDRAKYNTQAKMRELVRRERRVELAFEGHRRFDIHRWSIGEEVMNGPVYGAKLPDSDELYLSEIRRFNPDKDNLWPIPTKELLANTNMADDQNPGY